MSKDFNHKIEAKFKNSLIPLSKIPFNILQLWDRHNWRKGKYKNEKQFKEHKIIEKQFKEDIKEHEINN